ncbi:MAG: hypothetical protein AAB669_01785 [Patescibacteria group bacterium]
MVLVVEFMKNLSYNRRVKLLCFKAEQEGKLQQLILPKLLVLDRNIIQPLFFTAGPIKGGGNWQEKAWDYLANQLNEMAAAIPRRWKSDHRLFAHRATGQEDAFDRQTLWERHYMQRASRWGCLVFWLPCESKTEPRTDGQPYARDTYGELGAWRSRLGDSTFDKVVIGAEPDFPGLSVITCNINEDLGREFPIYSTLEETLDQAILLAQVTSAFEPG